MSVFWRKAKI